MRGPHAETVFGDGWAVIEDIGGRDAMEDRFVAGQAVYPGMQLFGVFDGHKGSAVAEHCKRSFSTHVRAAVAVAGDKDAPLHPNAMRAALVAAVKSLDDAGFADRRLPKDVGSTACVAVLSSDDVWVVNVGDSRAVLKTCGTVRQVSQDHKPALEGETRRILSHGGFLTYTDGPARIMGGLNLSRSIGDWDMRPFVVSTPTIERHARRCSPATTQSRGGARNGAEYIVLATDGLWDVMSNEAVAEVIDAAPRVSGAHTRRGIGGALSELVRRSRRGGSTDNITIVYVGVM